MGLKRLTAKDFNLLIKSANLYENNLKNKDDIDYIEVKCRKNNFLHLTGVKYINNNKNIDNNIAYANVFYDLILANRLNINNCYYKQDGTTHIKLGILSQIFNFPYNAAMIGNYNNAKPQLFTEKLCGGVACCLGFVSGNNASLYPNTTLKRILEESVQKLIQLF